MQPTHLNALRALEAAVRLGSFKAAGEELFVTPAAVGQQVKKLEDMVGYELLVRHSNGFTPSQTALRVAERLTAGFDQLSEALDLMHRRSDMNRLAISVVPTIAEHWLAPRMPDFWRRHPGIDLRIDSTHTIHYQAEPDFDFAFRYGPESPDGQDQIDLYREHLIPACVPALADNHYFLFSRKCRNCRTTSELCKCGENSGQAH